MICQDESQYEIHVDSRRDLHLHRNRQSKFCVTWMQTIMQQQESPKHSCHMIALYTKLCFTVTNLSVNLSEHQVLWTDQLNLMT